MNVGECYCCHELRPYVYNYIYEDDCFIRAYVNYSSVVGKKMYLLCPGCVDQEKTIRMIVEASI